MTVSERRAMPSGDGATRYGGAMSKPKVIAAVAVLWILAMLVQSRIDTRRHYYNPMLREGAKANFVTSLRNNMFGASMLGFREVVAGMLWVKADELFHEGKYQELVPYFSMVTFMDPHQIDVYSTGAWHLMYNFGDPRMVPQGLAFLHDGLQNNPNVWDLYFQLGWVNFDWPIEDYPAALPYFQQATEHKGQDGTDPPRYIAHMVGHAYARLGRINEAEDVWRKNIAFADQKLAEAEKSGDKETTTFWQQERDVCRNNLNLVVVRAAKREGLAQHPRTLGIDVKAHKLQPRVLIVNAKVTGLPTMYDSNGSVTNGRLEIVLQDKDYDKLLAAHKTDYAWIGKHLTKYRSIYNIIEANGTVTDKGSRDIKIELNKDPMLEPPRNPTDLYPLESQQYELIVRLDPRVKRQPEQVQDELGWTGEGIKPGPNVVIHADKSRDLEKHIILNRDDVL